MANERDKSQDETWLTDLPVTSENIGFKPEEMNACPRCGKSNPPTRPNCFYCSADLETAVEGSDAGQLSSRVLENWEKGFNVVYLPVSTAVQQDISGVARFLSMDIDTLEKVIGPKSIIPIARLESPEEAAAVAEYLSRRGIECTITGDDLLESDKLPVRLRGLKFSGENLILTRFNTNEEIEIHRDDILLIVTGALFEAKTETIEKRKKKQTSIVLETQAKSDSGIIDIYVGGDSIGYRIPVSGFDFSCLGAEKGLLAAENIRRLTEVLRNFAPSAKFVGNYSTIRELLDAVWPVERRRDSHGRQGTGFGGKDFTNIESINNLQQFTKYSRLQRNFL